MSNSLQPHGLYSPWNSPGQNTRVSSLFLLQGIFPAQGSNPCLPHCREVLYQLSHKGILEWLAYPFSSGSSWPYINASVKCDFAASPKKWNLFPHPLTLVRTCGFFLVKGIWYTCSKTRPQETLYTSDFLSFTSVQPECEQVWGYPAEGWQTIWNQDEQSQLSYLRPFSPQITWQLTTDWNLSLAKFRTA